MKNIVFLICLLSAVIFTACGTTETHNETPPVDQGTEAEVTTSEGETSSEPVADYSDGYASFTPPTHGELLPQDQWESALVGSWINYGFIMDGEMNSMVDVMQNIETYTAEGGVTFLLIMPSLEQQQPPSTSSWELSGDKLIIDGESESQSTIVEVSNNHIGYNLAGGGVVEGVDLEKVMYYKYRVPTLTE